MTNPRKNRVKLLDIAQASGVSLTAVSLALSEKPGISQETRVRVLEMARSMGYRFKSSVMATPGKALKTIGLLVKSSLEDEPHANHFYSHVIAGVEGTCRQMGISLMFANLPVDFENHPLEIPALLEKGDVNGILLAGVYVDHALDQVLSSRDLPAVLIDSYCPTRVYNAVLSDNFQGAYQATESLIRMGHREIAFIGGHENAYPSFRDRRSGYRQALVDYEISQPYFADCAGNNRAEITAVIQGLVHQHPTITGIIGVNDETAIAGMFALIEMGIHIPQDISIIGFDDIYISENVVPALTTMRVNKQSMGRLAVQMLVNQTFQPDGSFVTSVFRPTLIERGSTRPVPRQVRLEERRETGVA